MRRLFKADHLCCTCPSMLSMPSATRQGLTLPSVYLQTFPDPLTRNRLLRPRHSIPAGSEQRVAAVWAARVTGVVDHSGVSSRARVSPMQQTPASERKPNVFIDDIETRTRWKAAIRFGSNARDTTLSRRGLNVFVEGLVDCPASVRGSADLVVNVLPPKWFGFRDAATTVALGEGHLNQFAEWNLTATISSLGCNT